MFKNTNMTFSLTMGSHFFQHVLFTEMKWKGYYFPFEMNRLFIDARVQIWFAPQILYLCCIELWQIFIEDFKVFMEIRLFTF